MSHLVIFVLPSAFNRPVQCTVVSANRQLNFGLPLKEKMLGINGTSSQIGSGLIVERVVGHSRLQVWADTRAGMSSKRTVRHRPESASVPSFVLSSSLPRSGMAQPHVGSLVVSSRTVTIDNLPGEVLLEIFDHYFQSFGQKLSLRVWSHKNGWFKLVHVCHKWRCIVLASPLRLRLLLYFTESTPTRAAALESQSLSHLPILVDYSKIVWNASAQTRLISALREPNRVNKIAISGSRKNFDKICKALDLPFPALLSFELHNAEGRVDVEPILLASSFMTSIKSLPHLRLANVRLSPLLPLLSVTRALVFLDLAVDTLFSQTGGASLLTHLQHIPHLRKIQVSTQSDISNYTRKPPITTVSLAELSYFCFSGQCTEIEWLVAGLTTPPLRGFRISVADPLRTLHISHLPKFIRVAGVTFYGARLSFLWSTLTTTMFAPPHSTNDQSGIITFRTPLNAHIGSALSPMLATLEDVFLSISIPITPPGPLLRDLVHWRQFFEELRNVKVLRLHHDLIREVADMLRRPTVNPSPAQQEVGPDATTTTPSVPIMNGSRSTFTLDTFPLLEKIVVYARTLDSPISPDQLVSRLESFREYMIARQEVGRPVEVLWNMNLDLPKFYMLPDCAEVGRR